MSFVALTKNHGFVALAPLGAVCGIWLPIGVAPSSVNAVGMPPFSQ